LFWRGIVQEQGFREWLRQDVRTLAWEIGERNLFRYPQLEAAARVIEQALKEAGYEVHRQAVVVAGMRCENIEVELIGSQRPDEMVIVGAHYDSVIGSPGANDNASGVAALLALARVFAGQRSARTLRFVAFVNEEPPFFQTDAMGSVAYAKRCRIRGERVMAMLSLETLGYYAQARGTQRYPVPFGLCYPSRGNFIGFVSNVASRRLLREVVGVFRRTTSFPSEGAALPGTIAGIGWSDHWAFWRERYPAVMVTDTALFRYPHYHTEHDTPDKLDYDRLAQVVAGLERVVTSLVSPGDTKAMPRVPTSSVAS
jgi:Zn-dependent M28 family amino/carboxypeptidase